MWHHSQFSNMTPQEIVQKWSPSTLRERQASQDHFIDLCRILDEPTPAEADPTGKSYCIDAGAEKTIGRDGLTSEPLFPKPTLAASLSLFKTGVG